MKPAILFLALLSYVFSAGQPVTITGRVINEDRSPVPNATISIKHDNRSAVADNNGFFSFASVKTSDTLVISAVGYETAEEPCNSGPLITIILTRKITALETVVINTGYQSLVRERITGSVETISNDLLNRSVSANWLSRLEGVSAVYFDKRSIAVDQISIRGRSTIFANAKPLVIVDNFPYDGDLETINPNDIETVTILKDAAAASIWGARAGNGVIVITTKKGGYNRKPGMQFNANTTIGKKPDLFYNPAMSANDFINVETFLFSRGFYNGEIANNSTRPVLSPVVEILAARRAGQLSAADSALQIDALRNNDYRNDLSQYFYRVPVSQQYAVSYSGGMNKMNYYVGLGYDRIRSNLVGNSNDRLSFSSRISFSPARFIDIEWFANLVESGADYSIGANISSGGNKASLYPYARFAADDGTPIAIPKDHRFSFIDTAGGGRLLDWKYRPLDELRLADNKTQTSNKRMGAVVSMKLTKALSLQLLYQYEKQDYRKKNHYSELTYFTRNLINRFYNPSATNKYGIPLGGILDQSFSSLISHNGRLQANYNHTWSSLHHVSAIAGAEIKQSLTGQSDYRLYGYSDDVLTFTNVNFADNLPVYSGLANAQPVPNITGLSEDLLRFVSVYANAAYTYRKTHTASLSARKDAANIFGVSSNQKWVPLWSAGYSWIVSNEKFYTLKWLPSLNLRITYGYNGNVDNTLAAFTTIRYNSNATFTSQQYATIRNQYNPELRWEKTAILNTAIDFATPGNRLSGTVEYYRKKGTDLIGFAPIDPTTGVQDQSQRFQFNGNVASMKGTGVELALNTINIQRRFTWSTAFLFNLAKTKVTSYVLSTVAASSFLSAGVTINPVPGKPLYTIYSYRWAGLHPATGDPQGFLNGAISKDYSALTGITINDLIYNGSAIPEIFGSVRNTISYKSFSVSANIIYKCSYYFRRPTLRYGSLYTNWQGHADFAFRWQKPGDELHTNVPSMIYPNSNIQRDNFYGSSEILIERGDHIRLQDISLSCDIAQSGKTGSLKNVRVYGYINNIGLIWKANKSGLDPDYVSSGFPLPTTFSLGVKANF